MESVDLKEPLLISMNETFLETEVKGHWTLLQEVLFILLLIQAIFALIYMGFRIRRCLLKQTAEVQEVPRDLEMDNAMLSPPDYGTNRPTFLESQLLVG